MVREEEEEDEEEDREKESYLEALNKGKYTP